jgi:hypothetical protein
MIQKEKAEEMVKTLKMIADDAEKDAAAFDGKPFTGKTVGTYFGNHGASIAALAGIITEVIKSDHE